MSFPTAAASVTAIDVQPNLSPEETLATARIAHGAAARSRAIKGVLVLTDIFGATPSNVAQKLVDGVKSRLITGVNLPMLLRSRELPPRTAGRAGVARGDRRHPGRDAGGHHRAAEPGQTKP